jgi:hypothetical protein
MLRDYLFSRMSASREIRRSVVLRIMNKSDVSDLVTRALDDASAWIRADKPKIFEDCDRVRAEGEFRCGVAVPLGVVLCSICSIYTKNLSLIIVAALPVVFIYFSGMRKEEEAAKVIVSCISAGITTVNLEVSDARLLQWPTNEPSLRRSVSTRKRTYPWASRRSQASALASVDYEVKESSAASHADHVESFRVEPPDP